ncbi:glucose-1-phosphate thymidylyltransferase [candidate division WOR-3 bacterium]|nr:glucose-1-phosphate thymidylyltransferase [candidate division WOR-3 bacterium]
MKGLILSGGFGTRLRPLTYTGAKQLIPVANKPIIHYGIEALARAGIKELGIVVGATSREVEQAVGNGSRWGISIQYIQQEAPLGLAHAIKVSRKFLGNDAFVMYLGDNILREGINEFVKNFNTNHPQGLILLTKVANPQEFGVAVVDAHGAVKQLIEKPKDPPSDLALVGVYIFDQHVHTAIDNIQPSWRDELEITDAIQWLLDNNYKVESHMVQGWWKDTGKPDDIIEANLLVLEDISPAQNGQVEDSTLTGRIRTGKGSVIIKSVMRGPIVIGENARIVNSYIGPFSSIGNNAVIENSEIECSVIMEGALLKNVEKRIDRSIIGKNAVINVTDQSPRTHKFILGDQSYIEIAK